MTGHKLQSTISKESVFESPDVVSAQNKFLTIMRTHRQHWTNEEHNFITSEPDTFFISSLFSDHVCGYMDLYHDIKPIKIASHRHISKKFSVTTNLQPCGIGTILLKHTRLDKTKIKLENTLFLPGYVNVLSINALIEHGKWELQRVGKSKTDSHFCLVYKDAESTFQKMHVTKHSNGMYKLRDTPLWDASANIKDKQNMPLEKIHVLFCKDDLAKLCHLRFGHMPWEALHEHVGIQNFKVGHGLCDYCDAHGCNTMPYKIPDCKDNSINSVFYVQITQFSKVAKTYKLLATMQDKQSGFVHSFSSKTLKLCIQTIKDRLIDLRKSSKTNPQQRPAVFISCAQELGDILEEANTLKAYAEPLTTYGDEVKALVICDDGKSKCHTYIQSYIEYVVRLLDVDMNQWHLLLESATEMHNHVTIRETDKITAYNLYHCTSVDKGLDNFRALGCTFLQLDNSIAGRRKLYTTAGFNDSSFLIVKVKSGKNQICQKLHDDVNGYFFEEPLLKFNLHIFKPAAEDPRSFDFIFNELKSCMSPHGKLMLEALLRPVHNLLKACQVRCQKNIIFNVSDVNYPVSNELNQYELDILKNFQLLEIKRDTNSLFASVSVALFGHANCWQLLKIMLLQHVIKHWDTLEANSKKIFGVDINAIVDSLKSQNQQPTIMHSFLISTMIDRPVYVLVFNRGESTYSFEHISSSSKTSRQPIFLCLIDTVFYPLINKDTADDTTFFTECFENMNTPYVGVSNKFKCAPDRAMLNAPLTTTVEKKTFADFGCHVQMNALDELKNVITKLAPHLSSLENLIPQPWFVECVQHLISDIPTTLTAIQKSLQPLMFEYKRSEPEVNDKIQELSACLKVLKKSSFYSTGYTMWNKPNECLQIPHDSTSWETTDEDSFDDDDSYEQNRSGLNLSESSSDTSDHDVDESKRSGVKVLRKYRRQCAFAPACKTKCSTVEEMKAHYIAAHGVDKEYGTLTGNLTIVRDRLNKLRNVSERVQSMKPKKSKMSQGVHDEANGAVADGNVGKNTHILCPHCDESFFTQRDIYKHIQESHCELGRFACRFCNECLLSKVAIIAHEKLEHSKKYLNEWE